MQPNRFHNDLLLHNEYQTKIERLPCLIVLSVNRMISTWSIDLPQKTNWNGIGANCIVHWILIIVSCAIQLQPISFRIARLKSWQLSCFQLFEAIVY